MNEDVFFSPDDTRRSFTYWSIPFPALVFNTGERLLECPFLCFDIIAMGVRLNLFFFPSRMTMTF